MLQSFTTNCLRNSLYSCIYNHMPSFVSLSVLHSCYCPLRGPRQTSRNNASVCHRSNLKFNNVVPSELIKECNRKLLACINLTFFKNVLLWACNSFLILRMQARHRSLPQARRAAIRTLGDHIGAILT